MGANYLLYVSATGTTESIWKLVNGTGTELWSGVGAQIFGGPAVSRDGRNIAFSVRQHGKALLYLEQSAELFQRRQDQWTIRPIDLFVERKLPSIGRLSVLVVSANEINARKMAIDFGQSRIFQMHFFADIASAF